MYFPFSVGGFEPRRRHCVVSLSKNINPSLVLVQPRKTRPYITERVLMGRKESNQTNQTNYLGRTSLFQILEVLGGIFHFYSNSNRTFCEQNS